MGVSGFTRGNTYVTGDITAVNQRIIIPCTDATQVWARCSGTFDATYQPEVIADRNLPSGDWVKVDIWELETRRYFNTTSAGKTFIFSDLMGAAYAAVRSTAFTSGPLVVELRTLHSNPANPRMIWYPEEVLADGYGAVLNPTAGTVVAAITDPGEGVYEVEVIAYYKASAPAAADDSNLALYEGGAIVGRIPMPRSQNERGHRLFKYVDVRAATNDLEVRAVGNATSGVLYEVLLSAQRLF